MRLLLTISFIGLFCTLQASTNDSATIFQIQYNNNFIQIDGNSADWEAISGFQFNNTSVFGKDDNIALVRMLWDPEALYFSAFIHDKLLVGLEKSTVEERIHFNDSFEFYIDSQNDSDSVFDLNDFQFIFDVKGGLAIFKGDRLNTSLKYGVPKASGIANIIIDYKTTISGTLNNNDDIDSSYFVECRIPWISIGKVIKTGDLMKADFCVNDNDTLVNFYQIQEEHVDNYYNFSVLGNTDFGFPTRWPTIQLVGKEAPIHSFLRKVSSQGTLFFVLFVISLATAVFLYRKKKQEIRIESRTNLSNQNLVQYLTIPESPAMEKVHPVFDKTRAYIDRNLTETIKLEDLASEMAVSLRQLQRIFQSELNTTPKAFIITYKLEKAAKMLKNERLTVSEVSFMLGFSNPSYFSRVFKKYFGIPPTSFADSEQKKGS